MPGLCGSHEFLWGRRQFARAENGWAARAVLCARNQRLDARRKDALSMQILIVPENRVLDRRPRRVTDVTAGAVPAASPQTPVRASAPSCRLRGGDPEVDC